MPNPDAIVSTDVRLEPALEQTPPEEALRSGDGLTVIVEGERRIRLDPADPRSAGLARVIDGAARQHLPVYLEVDPASGTLTRLLLPQVGRVVAISASADGVVDVRLDTSHARRILRPGTPDGEALERQLRAALGSPEPVLVGEDDRPEGRVPRRGHGPAAGQPTHPAARWRPPPAEQTGPRGSREGCRNPGGSSHRGGRSAEGVRALCGAFLY